MAVLTIQNLKKNFGRKEVLYGKTKFSGKGYFESF